MHFSHPELAILAVSLLLFFAVFASKTSGRLGVPSLLLFMLLGWLAGPQALKVAQIDSPGWLELTGNLALAIILFNGGLDTSYKDVRPMVARAFSLATLGVLLTAVVTAAGTYIVLRPVGCTPSLAFLIGAIVSSTDAAAVFSVLRSKGLSLKHRLKPMLELESGSNDPMALLLTTIAVAWCTGESLGIGSISLKLLLNLSVGAALGIAIGWATPRLINRLTLPYDGLFSVLVLTTALFAYITAQLLHGNGLLSVYFAGIMIAKDPFIHKQSVAKFFDGIAWIMQIFIFVALGLIVDYHALLEYAPQGILIAVVLMFVARPSAVYASLLPFKGISHRERVFTSWVGLKGAAPLVFAIMPFTAGNGAIGHDTATLVLNVVLFIVLLSVILQGTTLAPLARLLRLDLPTVERTYYPLEIENRQNFQSFLQEIIIPDDCLAIGKTLVALNLPTDSLIVLISRGNQFIMPNGSTEIHEADRLLVLATTAQDLEGVYVQLGLNLPETT